MPRRALFIFGGAIGDTLLGVQLMHALQQKHKDIRLTMVSTKKSTFVEEFLKEVPPIRYWELPRDNIVSWFSLLPLAFLPHLVVFLEPFQNKVPLWWKIIARIATLMPGSVEIRCQSRPQKVSSRVRVLPYSPQKDNLFSIITRVVPLWGGHTAAEPLMPSLPIPNDCATAARPYILFHFFAGAYRRSFPLEKVEPLLYLAQKQFPEYEFVLTCTKEEEKAALRMIKNIENARVVVSPHARTLMCMLVQSDLCVGVASGVTHIAAHLDVPSVVLCNLSDPCWLPTYNEKVTLLYERAHCGCKGDKTGECSIETKEGLVYRCLYDIATERIVEAMHATLKH